ncbi:hypothetical protein [Paenibacillus caseinilyticus]|uniref:hypothetical protein n=1 Tax=Paenibacillus caseinilyticus TaxID=3098138 RepID=UPI0022B8CC85|nr:hypothetical protein [Paenibacillus caseinilyticus]MCZ8520157.1 hypothetical protein [Paenibacillus caseinilyticus]
MPEQPMPVSRGLFDHKERLGPAVWEFLWCIDAVTTESVDEQGIRWGFVHNGAPVKHERIASELHSSSRTVQRNMDRLKHENYIQTVRTGRGEIIKVRNNKKDVPMRVAKNGASDTPNVEYLPPSDTTNMAYQGGGEMPKMAYHTDSDMPKVAHQNPSDTTDMAYQGARYDTCGISKRLTITTTITEEDIFKGQIEILDAYCKLHDKLDIHVRSSEREAMGKMIAGGMPIPFIIRTMGLLYEDKRQRAIKKKNQFKPPSSFTYYVGGINDAWENVSSVSPEPAAVLEEPIKAPPKEPQLRKGKSKLEEAMEFLDQFKD